MKIQRAVYFTRFLAVILCTVFLLTIALCGLSVGNTRFGGIFEKDTIRLGLDLAGGSVITYQAITTDTGSDLANGMASILEVIRTRLDSAGLTEALCYNKVGDDMITIEIPSVDDPAEAVEKYMQTAKLTFKDKDGKVLLDGSDVKKAEAGYGDYSGSGSYQYVVSLTLTDAGATKFAEATKQCAINGTALNIALDDEIISSPTVDSSYKNTGITGGKAIISGSFDYESATELASLINAGALKYELKNVEQRTVGASLGANSLQTSLIAGGIGLLIVLVIMLVFYRVPGLMADIALIAYSAIFFLVLIWTNANLTLPGIAGIVLSIGMAVDANVVIFERIKEELALGKSAKAAVKSGYKGALWAVLDSNVTTLIAAGVLYVLGSGSIKGFATTLFFGVIISFITAVFLTRLLLNLGIGMGLSKPSLYGYKQEGGNKNA